MSEKKTYKILTPPVMMTIAPGKDKPLTAPITELRFDEVELSEEDAVRLAANGTIESIPLDSKPEPDQPIVLPPAPELELEPELETIELQVEPTAEQEALIDYPPFDISEDADVVIPLIQLIDDRLTLERLLQDEQAGRNRKGVKNAINERLGAL